MERIVENHQEYFFDKENANEYLNNAKNASKARFSSFLSSLKPSYRPGEIKNHVE